MKKRVSALFLVLVMVVACMAGCGKKGDLLETAMKTAEEAKSTDVKMTMDMDMSMEVAGQSQDVSMSMNMDMTMFKEPLKAKTIGTIDMAGQKMEMDSYIALEGDKYMTYVNNSGKWQKMAICDKSEYDKALQQAGGFQAKEFIQDKEKLVQGEDVTEDGKTYAVYTGKMTKDMIKDELNGNSSITSSFSGIVDPDAINEVIDSMEDIPYTVWLDKDAQTVYRVKFSMISIMEVAIKKGIEMQAEASGVDVSEFEKQFKMDFKKCDIDMVYKSYNESADFEIPKEALEAEETSVDAAK